MVHPPQGSLLSLSALGSAQGSLHCLRRCHPLFFRIRWDKCTTPVHPEPPQHKARPSLPPQLSWRDPDIRSGSPRSHSSLLTLTTQLETLPLGGPRTHAARLWSGAASLAYQSPSDNSGMPGRPPTKAFCCLTAHWINTPSMLYL